MYSKKYPLSRGATLIELMLALMISMIILSSLIEIFISTQSVTQTQRAISTIMMNSDIAFHCIKSDLKSDSSIYLTPFYNAQMKSQSMAFTINHIKINQKNTYFIGKTFRINALEEPIYALYKIDNNHRKQELVEGINNMMIRYYVLINNQVREIQPNEINQQSKIMGVSITLTLTSLNEKNMQKNEYMYVSI